MKNKIKIHDSEIYSKVIHYFFSYPEKAFGLTELSKNINASKTSTKLAVEKLIKENFVQKEEIGNSWRISMIPKNPYIINKKIPYNLKLVYESEILYLINKKIKNSRAIILFGSYRWGTDNENSDVDIAIEILGKEKLKIESLTVIKKLGYRKNVPINLHIFSKNNIDINLFANIANGIVLEGFLEVKK
jgi:predicted nucleotidyltransferase